ncbi:MAG: NINE protein [Christensenellales bacterium]|jgi:hypothetical protein
MNCTVHPQREAAGTCVTCQKPFCADCLAEYRGAYYCRDHVAAAIGGEEIPTSRVPHGSAAPENEVPRQDGAASGPNTGGQPHWQDGRGQSYHHSTYNHPSGMPTSHLSKIAALLLCIFLGPFGAHRFYAGKVGTGLLYLVTGGLCGIGVIVDIVLIATNQFTDQYGRPVVHD